jgi:hypothetical protein
MEWINYLIAALPGMGLMTLVIALLQRRWQQADKLDAIRDSLEAHIARDDERYVKQCRTRILRFNDELIRGDRHTKEHFYDVLDDITEYTQYCRTHKDFKNEKAVMAIANVKRVYQKCEVDNSFLE